jgi:hypothetical protein
MWDLFPGLRTGLSHFALAGLAESMRDSACDCSQRYSIPARYGFLVVIVAGCPVDPGRRCKKGTVN